MQSNERKIYNQLKYWIKKAIGKSPSVSSTETQENPGDDLFVDDMYSGKSSSDSKNKVTHAVDTLSPKKKCM